MCPHTPRSDPQGLRLVPPTSEVQAVSTEAWQQQLEAVLVTLRRCIHPEHDEPPGPAARMVRQQVRVALKHLEQMRSSLGQERELREHLMALLEATTRREAHCRYRADHDALTALPNWAAFMERLQNTLSSPALLAASPPPLAVMMLDLDQFKPVNDQHGHAAGDQVLRILGARLAHAIRAGDFVARLGGDEFALVVLDGNQRGHLALMAEKLLAAVAEPVQLSAEGPSTGPTQAGARVNVRASVGIASFPADGRTPEQLLAAADRAMYHAKRAGLGVWFASDVDAETFTRPTSG
jgi:diguanylate cyclase (GGDEF)-like protein